MPVITLTTDLGITDHYVSSIKGAILCSCPNAVIIDISHKIKPFDFLQASFVIKNSYRSFPEGSVHIIGVNVLDRPDTRLVGIKYNGHYFLGPDNGIFGLLTDGEPVDLVVEFSKNEQKLTDKFPTRDILAIAAAKIINGNDLESMGDKSGSLAQMSGLRPITQDSAIRGSVIYVDVYGNAIINITKQLFEETRNSRAFILYFKRNDMLSDMCVNYFDVPEGEKLCLFNSGDHLEVAINKGNASQLFGLNVGDTIQIDFI